MKEEFGGQGVEGGEGGRGCRVESCKDEGSCDGRFEEGIGYVGGCGGAGRGLEIMVDAVVDDASAFLGLVVVEGGGAFGAGGLWEGGCSHDEG